MVLKVSTDREAGLDTMCLSPAEFADKGYHPFLATTQFDKVVIELSSDIPAGYIGQLVVKGNKVIPVFNELNAKTLQQLCEIVPDRSAELRYAFMRDKTKLATIVDELRVAYNWAIESKC